MPEKKRIKIEYEKAGRRIIHPGGRIAFETTASIDQRVQEMEWQRESLRLQIEHMGAEQAKCAAAVEPAPTRRGLIP